MTEFGTRYGPVAVVTGASSGIGRSFAIDLAGRGLDLVLTARRTDRLDALAAQLRDEHGTTVSVVTADLGALGGVETILDATAHLDVGLVVSNAGAQQKGPLESDDLDHLSRVVLVNSHATALLARGFVPRLKARGTGGIVFVSSVEGFIGNPYSATYSASKAFVTAFGEALWAELTDDDVDVVTLCPGATDTEAPGLAGIDVSQLDDLMSPDDTARLTLENLRNGPTYVPSKHYAAMFEHLLAMPRREALLAMGAGVRRRNGTLAEKG